VSNNKFGVQSLASLLKTLSIIGYLGMIGGLLGLMAMQAILSVSPFVISVQAAAVIVAVWARVTFRQRSFHVAADPTEGGLVTGGPYHFIRHPIYTAICVFTVAGVAANWSWAAGACGGLVIGSLVLRMFCEEKLVSERYPEFQHYAALTWRMIPYIY
jgi:protein-S-isoprenylcysteine O-methyltransferase Ste14